MKSHARTIMLLAMTFTSISAVAHAHEVKDKAERQLEILQKELNDTSFKEACIALNQVSGEVSSADKESKPASKEITDFYREVYYSNRVTKRASIEKYCSVMRATDSYIKRSKLRSTCKPKSTDSQDNIAFRVVLNKAIDGGFLYTCLTTINR